MLQLNHWFSSSYISLRFNHHLSPIGARPRVPQEQETAEMVSIIQERILFISIMYLMSRSWPPPGNPSQYCLYK